MNTTEQAQRGFGLRALKNNGAFEHYFVATFNNTNLINYHLALVKVYVKVKFESACIQL